MGKLGGKRDCVAAIALCALLVLAPTCASAAVPAFCKGRVVRDDARPLRHMPGEHPPPEGELPFGPRNLSMYALNFGAKVVLDGSHLGYRFAAKGGNARVLHLNWDVTAALKRVDGRGRVLDTVGTVHRRLGEVEGLEELQFSFPAHPGLYEVDISFRTLTGRELASYSEHFRVVPRRVKLRMAVSGDTFKAGETAYARVLNLGTVPAVLRPRLPVDREEGGAWVRVAEPPVSRESVEEFRWTVGGGQASPCVAFQVPADAIPGAYRFTSSALAFGQVIHRRTLTGGFEISAPAP
jgi:hypothetical protein